MPNTRFEIDRQDLRAARWVDVPEAPLADGEIRLRVDEFALTANNVTYASFGEAMNYWKFYPTGNPATGCIPVWGFATVTASRCDAVAVGERVYGYLPMATTLSLQPVKVDAGGFFDGSAHRRELHPVYNHYRRCAADPGHDAAHEAEYALLQPLFATAFLIDDFLADNDFFGAAQVVFSSASSKTAYGTAFCLAQRPQVRTVGLTSAGNLDFTRALGCYREVCAYGDLASLDPQVPTVYVDMNGGAALREAVHRHWADRLLHSCSVGGADWEALAAPGAGKHLPGARPTLFFAPAQAKKRSADWGAAVLQQRIGAALKAFITRAVDPASPWLTVVRGQGPEAVAAAYARLVDGRVAPREGLVLRP